MNMHLHSLFFARIKKILSSLLKPELLPVFFLVLGAILKFHYAIHVPYDISYHDLGRVYISQFDNGHIGYIQYISRYHALPKLSPQTHWGMHHPPLFYIIGASVLSLYNSDNDLVRIKQALETVQLVNMSFSCFIPVVCFFFFKRLGLDSYILAAFTAFVSFFPSFFHIGAALNNDCLLVFFVIVSLYYSYVWHQEKSLSSMIKTAFFLSLGMLTKSSACLVIPGIFCLWLFSIKKAHEQKMPIPLNHFFIFLLIFIPLGGWWLIRQRLLFNMPSYFMNNADIYAMQQIHGCSWQQRLLFPTAYQLMAEHFIHNPQHPEYFCNIWGQLFLTMNFDEARLFSPGLMFGLGSMALLWNSIILSGITLYGNICLVFSKNIFFGERLFFIVGNLVPIISIVALSFIYPQIACMNFRLIAWLPLLWMGGCGLCFVSEEKKGQKNELFRKNLIFLCYLMALISVLLFLIWG